MMFVSPTRMLSALNKTGQGLYAFLAFEKDFVSPSGLELGRHREGRREGVELLKDLHRLLKNGYPPLLKKPPTPF